MSCPPRIRATSLALAVLAALHGNAALAQAGNKATIAVLPFTIAEDTVSGDPLETAILVDVFNRVLVNTRKFTVVDRARLEKVARERRFDGQTNAGRVSIGRYLGAQFLVMGTVLDYSVEPPKELAYGSGWTRPVRISAEVQVVDTGSGQIVSARKAAGKVQARVANPAAVNRAPREAIEGAAEEVAKESLIGILAAVFPIKVIDVSGGDVMLNRGEDGGLEVGSVLHCYAAGKAIKDPDTGELLGNSEIAAGSVRVSEVLPKFTKAQVLDGDITAKNVCRIDGEAAAEAGHRSEPPAGPIHSY